MLFEGSPLGACIFNTFDIVVSAFLLACRLGRALMLLRSGKGRVPTSEPAGGVLCL